jgi:hypothetical protein
MQSQSETRSANQALTNKTMAIRALKIRPFLSILGANDCFILVLYRSAAMIVQFELVAKPAAAPQFVGLL